MVPPTPKAQSSSPKLRDAARDVLSALTALPHCRDHAPGCPYGTAGPCMCGAEHLAAAISALGTALER